VAIVDHYVGLAWEVGFVETVVLVLMLSSAC